MPHAHSVTGQQSQRVPQNVANVVDVVRTRKINIHFWFFSLFFLRASVFYLFARTSNKVNIARDAALGHDLSV
jgi:hypothetical protein